MEILVSLSVFRVDGTSNNKFLLKLWIRKGPDLYSRSSFFDVEGTHIPITERVLGDVPHPRAPDR